MKAQWILLLIPAVIVCLTLTGHMARAIASYHPSVPIVALSPRADIMRRLALVSGVHPVLNSEFFDTDKSILGVGKLLGERGLVKPGDVIVLTAGVPLASMRQTNLVKLYHVTEDDCKGAVAASPREPGERGAHA